MRSLWRMIALRWLGGQGTEALIGDSALLDLLTIGERAPRIGFEVSRRSGVSHHAMNSHQGSDHAVLEPMIGAKSGADRSR
jgi:hypothetical protein